MLLCAIVNPPWSLPDWSGQLNGVDLHPGHIRAPRLLGDRKLQLGHAQISRPPAAPHLWQLDYRQFALEDFAC